MLPGLLIAQPIYTEIIPMTSVYLTYSFYTFDFYMFHYYYFVQFKIDLSIHRKINRLLCLHSVKAGITITMCSHGTISNYIMIGLSQELQFKNFRIFLNS